MYVLAKNRLPLTMSLALAEFGKAVDPASAIFRGMASGQTSIGEKSLEIHQGVIYPDTQQAIKGSPCWSLLCDESLDVSEKETMMVYARYVHMEKMTLETTFLELTRIFGHPDAENLCCSLLNVVGDKGYNLPLEHIVSLASDGATAMLSPVNCLIGKLQQKLDNNKIYSQHCSTHGLVLYCKDA